MGAAITRIIEPRKKSLGDGFTVRRVLPFHAQKMVGPFIFCDHFGPASFPPGKALDVRPHPHIGLATVTYLFEGAIAHKDTVGSDLVIRPGAVNWMTAGRGIVHSERTPSPERETGHRMHGIQTWVALPRTHEEIDPDFVHHPADTLPEFDLGGGRARILAGEAWGHRSPVVFPWPIWYLAVDMPEGGAFEIPGDAAQERAVYVADGAASIDGSDLESGSMAILSQGATVDVTTRAGTKLMLAGGGAMDGPRLIDWNLVSSTRDRIDQAKADWRASIAGNWDGTPFALPEGEHEYIPLPEDQ